MGILVIALCINPRPLSALELKLSGLIMGSRVDTAGDNQNAHVIISNYVIMCFPPSGYQLERADNRKSCILNRERLSCPHVRRCRATKFVTSSEMTLRHFNGVVFFFYAVIYNFSHFFIKKNR